LTLIKLAPVKSLTSDELNPASPLGYHCGGNGRRPSASTMTARTAMRLPSEMNDQLHDLAKIEAFGRSLFGSSPQYKVPYWQTYRFGPGKWPYGKWVLDKLRWFIADPAKLLHAMAELERAKEREASILQPTDYVEINLDEPD
jgi:hypothetical protein